MAKLMRRVMKFEISADDLMKEMMGRSNKRWVDEIDDCSGFSGFQPTRTKK